MPSTREIRRRIRSVKNMTQITKAMEMVSASRMRRAQRNVLATRPYADRMLDERARGRQVECLAVGKKGRDFLVRTGQNLIAEVTKLGDYPRLVDTLGIATNVINGFREERYDEVYLVYSEFVNTLVQRASLKRLLPVEPPNEPAERRFDYTYEPGQDEVLNGLLPRFVEVQLYQAVLDSIAIEHSA